MIANLHIRITRFLADSWFMHWRMSPASSGYILLAMEVLHLEETGVYR